MKKRGTISRRLLQLALAAFLLRALVPVGMMAAPLAEGWIFKLCPSGMSMPSYMALLGEHTSHSAHSSHSSHSKEHAQSDADPMCGLSAGFSALGAETELLLASANDTSELFFANYSFYPARAPPRSNHTRAPPAHF